MRFPPDFTHPYAKLQVAHLAAKCIAELAAGLRAVVQAGGCSGLWPIALSAYFGQVYTFEPAMTNLECLQANVATRPNISVWPCALGDAQRRVGLTRPNDRAGLWRVDGDGDVPMVALDDVLGDTPIDALVLDVEGSELAAWQGAERLITTHRPLLWFERIHGTDVLDHWLAAHDYTRPAVGMGRDCYSVHASRVS